MNQPTHLMEREAVWQGLADIDLPLAVIDSSISLEWLGWLVLLVGLVLAFYFTPWGRDFNQFYRARRLLRQQKNQKQLVQLLLPYCQDLSCEAPLQSVAFGDHRLDWSVLADYYVLIVKATLTRRLRGR